MTYEQLANFINFRMPEQYRQARVQGKFYWDCGEGFLDCTATGVQMTYDQALKDYEVWVEFNNE